MANKEVKTVAAPPSEVRGYMPQDIPSWGATLSLGFQQVLTMFPATVLVAILTKFDVGVTLLASGLGTIVALLITRRKIPMYYGSSFSYITVIITVMALYDKACFESAATYCPEGVRLAQVGIVATAILQIGVGYLIQYIGKERLDIVLPPIVTSSLAIVIGVALAGAALDMAAANWLVAFVTLIATVLFSVYLQGKGLWGMLPILWGAIFGYIVAMMLGIVDFTTFTEAQWIRVPNITFPAFTDPRAWSVATSVALIAIATIPESVAHLYQIDLYVDQLAKDLGRTPLGIKNLVGLNLIADGSADIVNGILGGCSGTNYGENIAVMAITRNYSSVVMMAAGAISIALGFVGKLAGLVGTIPVAVTGGLAIYLFGVIGKQGVALIQSEKVNLFDPKNLAIGAVILILGIGGAMALPDGLFPFYIPVIFPNGIPAIVFSAIVGILFNLIFIFVPPSLFGVAERSTLD
ncbi:MAG: uracil-xanthine permease family protein [Anaerolineales bacterium]